MRPFHYNLPPPRLSREGFTPVDLPKGTQRKHMLVSKPSLARRTRYIPALLDIHLAGLIGGLARDERKALNQRVAGSNPAAPTTQSHVIKELF